MYHIRAWSYDSSLPIRRSARVNPNPNPNPDPRNGGPPKWWTPGMGAGTGNIGFITTLEAQSIMSVFL